MEHVFCIDVAVNHENKTININDTYSIEHTKIYLELCQKLVTVLSDEAIKTYKIKLKDKTFKNMADFAEKNKLDLKQMLEKRDDSVEEDPDLEKRFNYHKPNKFKAKIHEDLRGIAKEFAYAIKVICPEGREQALALTKLEECLMWANAAVARNDD